MPHKVNPIDFENAEGNFGVANALFTHFSQKLPVSRLQRDLSDSTVERAFGTAFAHSLVGYRSLLRGLGKISVNTEAMLSALNEHPEVIAEAIQTVLRKEGVEAPYEKIKELTRGRKVTLEDFAQFIDGLDIGADVKKTPQSPPSGELHRSCGRNCERSSVIDARLSLLQYLRHRDDLKYISQRIAGCGLAQKRRFEPGKLICIILWSEF